MNRRLFIKIGALISLVIGAFPASIFRRGIFSRQGESFLFNLPKANTHVRHGLLTDITESISELSPSWFSDYRKEVFLKDGLAASNADLTYISMKINQQLINIGLKEHSFFIATNEDTSSIPIIDNKIIPFYDNKDFTGELLKLDKDISITNMDNHEILLIPLKGHIKINGKDVDDNSGLLLKNTQDITITTTNEAIVSIFRYI